MNFVLVVQVLVLADVGQPFFELLIGDVVALLLAELQEQHLVDRVDENLGRDLRDRLPSR